MSKLQLEYWHTQTWDRSLMMMRSDLTLRKRESFPKCWSFKNSVYKTPGTKILLISCTFSEAPKKLITGYIKAQIWPHASVFPFGVLKTIFCSNVDIICVFKRIKVSWNWRPSWSTQPLMSPWSSHAGGLSISSSGCWFSLDLRSCVDASCSWCYRVTSFSPPPLLSPPLRDEGVVYLHVSCGRFMSWCGFVSSLWLQTKTESGSVWAPSGRRMLAYWVYFLLFFKISIVFISKGKVFSDWKASLMRGRL